MPRRNEHGKLRTAPPRRKDLSGYTEPEPNRNRGTNGRFAKGNRVAERRALKSLIKRQLGADASAEEVAQLYKDSLELYRRLLAELPANDAPEVQDLVARRARWSLISARYAMKAAEAGLFGEQASKLLDMALKLDARAERLAVTARDEAERLARARRDEVPTMASRIEARIAASKQNGGES